MRLVVFVAATSTGLLPLVVELLGWAIKTGDVDASEDVVVAELVSDLEDEVVEELFEETVVVATELEEEAGRARRGETFDV